MDENSEEIVKRIKEIERIYEEGLEIVFLKITEYTKGKSIEEIRIWLNDVDTEGLKMYHNVFLRKEEYEICQAIKDILDTRK